MSLRFVSDENFTRRMAELLSVFDRINTITPLVDHFEPGTPDIEWITALASWNRKPAILGGDGRILRNESERVALKEADLTFVYLQSGWTNIPWDVQAWKILKAWPTVIKEVERARKPVLIEVTVNLKIDNRGPISSLSG